MYYSGKKVFSRNRRRPGRFILIILVVILAILSVYTVFDNSRLVVRTQQVFASSLPAGLEGFTVLHVSDLNGKRFGAGQKQIASALRGRKYNAVCLTGDMTGSNGDVYPLLELLAALDSSRPVYMIAGDSDPTAIGGQGGTAASPLADWIHTVTQASNAIYLGPPAYMDVGGSRVWFSDASQLALDLDEAEAAYAASTSSVNRYHAEVIAQTRAARQLLGPDDLHIALSHKPLGASFVQSMQGAADEQSAAFIRTVDLILAGSTEGGGWRLPFIGPLWAGDWFPEDARTKGYHYAGSVSMLQYISGGLGIDPESPLPPFRVFNTPEVTLLSFTSKMADGVLPDF